MEILAFTYAAVAYEDPNPMAIAQQEQWEKVQQMAKMGSLSLAGGLMLAGTLHCSAMALQIGDMGTAVESLQTALAAVNFYDGRVTGYYGAQTQSAVLEFQRDRGLPATGVADGATLQALAVPTNLANAPRATDFSQTATVTPGSGGGGGIPVATRAVTTVPEAAVTVVASAGTFSQQAVVQTPSNIGINVRNTPFGFIVDGKPDGALVAYDPTTARLLGGYTWVQVSDLNWVAQDYLVTRLSSGGSGGGGGSPVLGRGIFRVATIADPLVVRSQPNPFSAAVNFLAPGSVHDFSSTVSGELVAGSDRWLYVPSYGGYVSTAYVNFL